jgi:hypothetical protein
MDNRMEVRIIELEYENKQNIETISLLTKRIDKLEARPIMYQRQDYTGNPTGMVYIHGQNKIHNT